MGTIPRAKPPKKKYRLHSIRNQKFYNSKAWRDVANRIRTTRIYCDICACHDLQVVGKFVDHLNPINRGGELIPPDDELQLLCIKCDARKRGRGG